jgi:hypothetical protein
MRGLPCAWLRLAVLAAGCGGEDLLPAGDSPPVQCPEFDTAEPTGGDITRTRR